MKRFALLLILISGPTAALAQSREPVAMSTAVMMLLSTTDGHQLTISTLVREGDRRSLLRIERDGKIVFELPIDQVPLSNSEFDSALGAATGVTVKRTFK